MKYLIILALLVSCATPKNIANNRITYNTLNAKVVKVKHNLLNNRVSVILENKVKINNVPLCMFPFDSLKVIDYKGKYYWVE